MVSEGLREVLGRKRTLEILELLRRDTELNYSEIETEIPSSSDTIVDSLELLQAHDLVERQQRHKRDVRYTLTDQGEEFLQLIDTLDHLLDDSGGNDC
ncbi:winged helix-turn-helix transcriptional regulator [Halomicrobium salinisoli]|uniref:winged helix-turn-helix transcriptional regulator n=1 Tax=Halomicrobium salinisoli TaxID=2878391 RepID=UPI001CF0D197|nr:winged helix-turn-helix transcriptional regulator [Halomicrobium salinisoli]